MNEYTYTKTDRGYFPTEYHYSPLAPTQAEETPKEENEPQLTFNF